ncbi:hypothetical protein PIB30_071677 [Stylosanthes scabra]|uniref:Uncharacterized protein n=1 Tax=Stylosanthes scabra TaxID=79078 RepID=A0ABU6VM80_9FABA|nr:hypothetical protein [Stylosanthes scabra]
MYGLKLPSEPDAPSPTPTFHCSSEGDLPSFMVSSIAEAFVPAVVSYRVAVRCCPLCQRQFACLRRSHCAISNPSSTLSHCGSTTTKLCRLPSSTCYVVASLFIIFTNLQFLNICSSSSIMNEEDQKNREGIIQSNKN